MDSFLSKSPAETTEYAVSFASSLQRNEIVTLIGELGSGKTQFVKGVCQYFRVQDSVSSPTFVMLHRYAGWDKRNEELFVYHFDLYKIKTESEILELGYEEFFHGNGICLIEWADMLRQLTPHDRTEIRLSLGSAENERKIEVHRFTTRHSKDFGISQSTRKLQNEHPRH